MSDAATQEGVAEGMSDAEMLSSLTAMFDAQLPPDEPKEEQTAEEVEPTAEQVEVGDGETSEETEADEDTEESEADDEAGDEDEESSDDEKWTPKSLDDLAEALEMNPDEVASTLKVKIKVDGQEGEATLKDVIKSYQLEKTLNGRLEQHATERKTFEAESTRVVQTLQERLQDVEQTASAVEQLLMSEYQSIDWSDLKENDPTEYMLKQQELRDRYGAVQQVKSKLAEDYQKQIQEQQQQFQEMRQKQLVAEKEALLQKLPDWKDTERMTTELTQLGDYLKSHGATEEEINSMSDHRVLVFATKAMRYDQMQSKADPKMKQMKTKPKFAKPGARKDPVRTSEKRKQSAMNRAKSEQTDAAWTEALLAKLS